jgi:dihydropteroate synthase
MMHMKGEPKNMQDKPSYDNVLAEVKVFLKERLDYALAFGIPKERIIIDPGIGFGKRLEDNLRIINNLTTFKDLGRPILVGPSRKSFIGKILDLPPEERLEGTIASAVLSMVRGAAILRVHDVKAVKRAVVVAEAILNEAQDASSFVGNTSRYVH